MSLTESAAPSSRAPSGRIASLDVIKILSAFMVVFYHYRFFDLGHFENGRYLLSVPQFLLCLCSASVPLFFMVNGALLLNRDLSVQQIYAKAGRLALVAVVWDWLVDYYSWFLYALLVLYLLYPILHRAYRAKSKVWARLIMGAVFLMPFLYNLGIVLLMRFAPGFSFRIFGRTLSLRTLPLRTGVFRLYSILYYMLGAYLLDRRLPPLVSVLLILLGQAVVVTDVVVTSNYTGQIADAVNYCFPTVGALLLAIGFFTLLRCFDRITDPRLKRLLASLGSGVLTTYLLHVSIRSVLQATILPPGRQYSALLIAGIALAVCLLCWLIDLLLKRIPLVRELVRL